MECRTFACGLLNKISEGAIQEKDYEKLRDYLQKHQQEFYLSDSDSDCFVLCSETDTEDDDNGEEEEEATSN